MEPGHSHAIRIGKDFLVYLAAPGGGAQQEAVRSVELPPLQELSEAEVTGSVGPLIAGDWLTLVGPYVRDISSTSHVWWDKCLAAAAAAYQ